MPRKLRVHVLISGRVQGVGFRYSTRQQARSRKLTGWVRNLSDGRVEAEFQGGKDAVEAMLAWCKVGPVSAVVRSVETQPCEDLDHESGFALRT